MHHHLRSVGRPLCVESVGCAVNRGCGVRAYICATLRVAIDPATLPVGCRFVITVGEGGCDCAVYSILLTVGCSVPCVFVQTQRFGLTLLVDSCDRNICHAFLYCCDSCDCLSSFSSWRGEKQGAIQKIFATPFIVANYNFLFFKIECPCELFACRSARRLRHRRGDTSLRWTTMQV